MPGRIKSIPLELKSWPALWFGIIFPPMFASVFLALICISEPFQHGGKYALVVGGAVILCWALPWLVAIGFLEEVIKRRTLRDCPRPFMRAAITTTIIEVVTTGVLVAIFLAYRP